MKNRRLLFVDDELAIVSIIKRLFEQKFPAFEVLTATSPQNALAVLRERLGTPGFPCALVTDTNLRNPISGPELVKMVRAEFPKLRTIVLSAAPLIEYAERAAAAGADVFMDKNPNVRALIEDLYGKIECPTDTLPPILP